jgi:hypothetical protein
LRAGAFLAAAFFFAATLVSYRWVSGYLRFGFS